MFIHKRFPDGQIYQVEESEPTVRLCAGAGGTCRMSLAGDYHFPICPACRFQTNAFLMIEQAKRLGIL